jgi:hypothetical protein
MHAPEEAGCIEAVQDCPPSSTLPFSTSRAARRACLRRHHLSTQQESRQVDVTANSNTVYHGQPFPGRLQALAPKSPQPGPFSFSSPERLHGLNATFKIAFRLGGALTPTHPSLTSKSSGYEPLSFSGRLDITEYLQPRIIHLWARAITERICGVALGWLWLMFQARCTLTLKRRRTHSSWRSFQASNRVF